MAMVHRTPGDVAAEVIMSTHKGSFFLLEGVSDCLFWKPFVSPQDCRIIDAGGKTVVRGAVAKLEARPLAGVLGLVDADLEGLIETPNSQDNIVTYDCHDLECFLLRSPALDRLLTELADEEALRQLAAEEGRSFRESLLARGLLYGKLRWLAYRQRWSLDFEGALRLNQFLDEGWQLDEAALKAKVTNQEPCRMSATELEQALDDLEAVDPWRLCRGHDLMLVLQKGLENRFGKKNAKFGQSAIAKDLRLGFDRADLMRSSVAAAIRDWERGSRYQIFAGAD